MPLSFLKRIPRKLLHVRSLTDLRSQAFMDLKALVSSLNGFASLSLAESWDNVGLLVEPSPPHVVNTLFLTNDLTEDVMEEALQKEADLILSYHPPIFKPLKRVTWQTWKERLVIRALENRVGIYSPHTAYDAAPHGVNAWLAKGLGSCTTTPLHSSTASNYPTKGGYRIEFSSCSAETVLPGLREMPGVSLVAAVPARVDGEEQTRVSLNCTQHALLQVMAFLSQNSPLYEKTEIISLQKPPLEGTGMGRLCILKEPVAVSVVIERVKSHLRLPHVRLALGAGKTLESEVKVVALCAGSGTSVLQGTEADLYLTGEMSHHDVLDAVAKGTTVILCEHSNSERGFLRELQLLLATHLENKVQVIVSERDRDPLRVA
ncbi:PREDICTED: NIF3-like protein 1 [Gekko japonicus]|uniref:NIF3-like protein 1 n=1 Tax=Gekko japonicus TaxID=146911 RepID=A0ABM1JRS7_GEKJA|nr:PREDICTED: NIF3-like protein 1 [Gekko japonicus]XP_015264165.1 PREDICTED: NIF3-like protein 1 [Gekko japonicus]